MIDMTRRTRRRLVAGGGLLGAGAVAGAALATTLSAGAATPAAATVGSSATVSASASPTVPGRCTGPGARPRGFALDLSGTVTAVGRDTVTIRRSTGGTTTYTVTRASDIDKNGEAKLSSLAVGDAVRYSVRSGTTTIDKLHAGNFARDFPAGAPPAPWGRPGSGPAGSGGAAAA